MLKIDINMEISAFPRQSPPTPYHLIIVIVSTESLNSDKILLNIFVNTWQIFIKIEADTQQKWQKSALLINFLTKIRF